MTGDRAPAVSPGSPAASLPQRAAAEAVATAFLLAAIVGSGIAGERLSGGNAAIALLANSLASAAALAALILGFSRISGAHMNPVITLDEAGRGLLRLTDVPVYWSAQIGGAFAGVAAAHAMFGEPIFSLSRHPRGGAARILSEAIATFGLVLVVRGSSRLGPTGAAAGVATYILAAYWFTSSTSFANPAVTLARSVTDTFSGIRPADLPGFLLAQCGGGAAAAAFLRAVEPRQSIDLPGKKESS